MVIEAADWLSAINSLFRATQIIRDESNFQTFIKVLYHQKPFQNCSYKKIAICV